MKTYRFEEINSNMENLNKSFKDFLLENGITPEWIKETMTRYEYNDSDFIGWHLFYGDKKEQIKVDKDLLLSFIYKEKSVFNVSGNGWGTGLSIMLNLSSNYD
jgi:hypothetical protein